MEAAHLAYVRQLADAPLSTESRRTYASKVRQYLAWLASSAVDGDPLTEPTARDWAVRDYKTHLAAVLKRGNATVNNALAAIDDFYRRRGLGPARAERLDLPQQAPRALDARAVLRWIRGSPSPQGGTRVRLLPVAGGVRGDRGGVQDGPSRCSSA